VSAFSPTFSKLNPETIGRQGEQCLPDTEIGRNAANTILALGEIPQFRPLANFQQI
jgi:hypothetical protein